MRARDRWFKGRGWGLVAGAAVTLAAASANWLGAFESLDLSLLDWKFRHANRIEADPSIVMIDINDYAVDRVHSWPWPRRLDADLIKTLHELGARAILVDIVWSEPRDARIEHPALDADHDVDDSGRLLGEMTLEDAIAGAIWDDQELADALRDSGAVYVAMFGRLHEPQWAPGEIRERVYALFEDNLQIDFDSFRAEMDDSVGDDTLRTYEALRVAYLLERERFSLTRDEMAQRLGVESAKVEKYLARAKRRVARRLVRAHLAQHPEAAFPEVYGHFFPHKPIDVVTPDREDLLRAYRMVQSERVTIDEAPAVPESLRARLGNVSDLTLPLDRLARFADAGLVAFQATGDRGVLRRVPLLVSARGRMIKQLAFAMACDLLNIDDATIRLVDGKHLVMENAAGDRAWRIPLDEDGLTSINWHIDRDEPSWLNSFTHVPVTRVMEIPILRRDVDRENRRYALLRAECVNIRYAEAPAEYNRYVGLVRERDALLGQGQTLPHPDVRRDGSVEGESERSARVAALDGEIAAIEKEANDWVVYLGNVLREDRESGGSAWSEEPQAEWIMQLAVHFDGNTLDRQVAEAKAKLQTRIAEQVEALRPIINDKVCIVGYTASAVADTINTPVFKEVPAVMAHANVLNSMLRNRFPRTASGWVDTMILLAAGLLTTVVTSYRGPWFSLTTIVLIAVVVMGVSIGLFFTTAIHVAAAGGVLCAFASWALVTLYRQLTEERQRRAFGKALAQYTSPEIATQIARRSPELDLSPQPRRVTCFFSDLRSFTSISERLGAERTRALLNPYLEAMSRVLIEQNAMINKFIGDGIFAFFNPPIHPVADHARAACEAALRSFEALERLKSELADPQRGGLGEDVLALSMRIGLNTGEVFVGDYGSASKLDYTCIGDTVNLAARLEPANKVFGTRLLITESTLTASGDDYVVRPLGRLQVVGKEQAVPVYELIGRRGEVDSEQTAYAEMFADAIEKFQARDWDGALKTLESCRERHADDAAAKVLEENVRRCRSAPPAAKWNQAIELTVK